MNKKIGVLLVLPLLCSCHGTSASCETVLNNIKNIRTSFNYDNPSYEHFILTINRKVGEHTFYSVGSYSKEKKFFHSYSLEDNVLKLEQWQYVQTNSDGDTNIYTVERNPIATGNDKPVVVNRVSYSDDAWKITDVLARSNLDSVHSERLTESEQIIEYYQKDSKNKSLSLSSLNSTSYFLNYVQKANEDTIDIDETIEFKDLLFIQSIVKDGQQSEALISCSYDSFDVLYPKL